LPCRRPGFRGGRALSGARALLASGAVGQFLRFSLVGAAGFAVDTGVLYLLIFGVGLGPWLARLPSFLAASLFTWYANRRWTYPGPHRGSTAGQWLKFVTVNTVGFAVNYSIYAVLILDNRVRAQPVIAVAAGSLAGLAFNFTASRRFVFRRG
jgi:putative flippase GtrA